jgi:hypothetical protein
MAPPNFRTDGPAEAGAVGRDRRAVAHSGLRIAFRPVGGRRDQSPVEGPQPLEDARARTAWARRRTPGSRPSAGGDSPRFEGASMMQRRRRSAVTNAEVDAPRYTEYFTAQSLTKGIENGLALYVWIA